MMKTVTAHQPNYLPWLGFFSKIAHSDCLIVLDIADYPDRSVVNRNKIRTESGWCYLTIPIGRGFRGTKICEVKLPNDKEWQKKHCKTIQHHYTRADFFSLYQDSFERLYQKDYEYLWQLNEEIIFYLLRCFEINVEIIKASKLKLSPDLRKTDLLISCLKSVDTGIYLSGPSGRDYLDFEKFAQNNIDLRFLEFQHPVYKQRYPGFEPAMAAIDLLFNVGPEASEIIRASGSIVA